MNNFRSFAVWIVIAILLFALFSLFQGQASRGKTDDLDYSQFLNKVNAGEVTSVTITDAGTLLATFGFLKLETPLANIDEAHVTRNYRWWTAAGARKSLVDNGLTFGTNRSAGVCIHFREPVPSPVRRKGHPALTVTVTDLDGLVQRLRH